MNKRMVLTVLCLAAVIVAAPASADIAYFPNPTGSGHFDWGNLHTDPTVWLDIKSSAASQTETGASGMPGYFQLSMKPEYDRSDVIPFAGGGELLKGGPVHSALLTALDHGDPVTNDGSADWTTGSGLLTYPAIGSHFPEDTPLYIGARFDPGDGMHYGWIGVTRSGLDLDVSGWAYETEAGVPIIAGVPEPTALALLGVGVLGLLRRRR